MKLQVPKRRRSNHVNVRHQDWRSAGERVADAAASRVGWWPFIIVQSSLLALWIVCSGTAARE